MKLIILLSVILLASCSSPAPQQTTTYLLRSQQELATRQLSGNQAIKLGTVEVAAYLDQPGLVMTTESDHVHAARNSLWAEPLRISLRRFLITEISAASGIDIGDDAARAAADTRIDVTIDQLHGDSPGDAVLVAYWVLHRQDGASNFQFAERQALTEDGYDALVEAETVLLSKLARAIVASLAQPPLKVAAPALK